MVGHESIPTFVDPDPYATLCTRHKLTYTYSFQTDFLTGEEYLVRNVPRNIFFTGPDPQFKSLDDPDWIGDEYSFEDILDASSIANRFNLESACLKKIRGARFDWVTIESRIGEREHLDNVLERNFVDSFSQFGLKRLALLPSSEKRRKTELTKKRKLLDEERLKVLRTE